MSKLYLKLNTFFFYVLFNMSSTLCKGEEDVFMELNFPWDDPRIATAVMLGLGVGLAVGFAVASPVIKQQYDSTYWFPVKHTKGYYIERYNDIIENLLDKELINDGYYLSLYDKVNMYYKSIENNLEMSEVVKLQKYDYLLFLLKNQYIPDVLNGLPIN
jgi:hypothetical protein